MSRRQHPSVGALLLPLRHEPKPPPGEARRWCLSGICLLYAGPISGRAPPQAPAGPFSRRHRCGLGEHCLPKSLRQLSRWRQSRRGHHQPLRFGRRLYPEPMTPGPPLLKGGLHRAIWLQRAGRGHTLLPLAAGCKLPPDLMARGPSRLLWLLPEPPEGQLPAERGDLFRGL